MTPANYLILLARLVTKLENISRTSRCFCAISVPQRPPRLRKERRGRSAFGTEMAQKRPPVRCAGRLATHPHDITSNALCARLITKRLAFRRVGVYFVWRFTVAATPATAEALSYVPQRLEGCRPDSSLSFWNETGRWYVCDFGRFTPTLNPGVV